MTSAVDGRTKHYGEFYQVPGCTDLTRLGVERPLILVWGNCQAEAVRVLLGNSPSANFDTVRIPPVFELESADIAPLRSLAGRVNILLSQPVRDDYRGLPLGSAQVRAMMPPGGLVVHWPVVRYSGFHPYQAIVRDPAGVVGDPPVVPYHDLRTIVRAANGEDLSDIDASVDAYREVARASLEELARRERQQCDVGISDLFESSTTVDMFTINHPGNRILVELARRLQTAIGAVADADGPGRDLLGEVRAPADGRALLALGLTAVPGKDWSVRGVTVPAAEVTAAHLAWYHRHPEMIEAALARHRTVLSTLGLAR